MALAAVVVVEEVVVVVVVVIIAVLVIVAVFPIPAAAKSVCMARVLVLVLGCIHQTDFMYIAVIRTDVWYAGARCYMCVLGFLCGLALSNGLLVELVPATTVDILAIVLDLRLSLHMSHWLAPR